MLAGCLLVGTVVFGWSGSSGSKQTPTASARGQATVWLCRPGLPNNPCLAKLTSTVVSPDGTTSVQSSTPAKRPAVDCFYVYPTVSPQPAVNADLTIDPAEEDAAVAQASRFSQDCAVFAPMYRQITIAGGRSPASYRPGSPAVTTAYDSLLGAWRDYLDHYNHGRGIVLIGHSQGASLLIKLVRSEIDSNPQKRKLLVSALIIGGNVVVPIGKDRGGSFANIPACHSEHQTGCVIAYSAYDTTPPPTSFFGRIVPAQLEPWQAINASQVSNLQVLCTDPAALSGYRHPRPLLHNYPVSRTIRFSHSTDAVTAQPVGQIPQPVLGSMHEPERIHLAADPRRWASKRPPMESNLDRSPKRTPCR